MKSGSVSYEIIHTLLDYAKSSGIDPEKFYKKANFDPGILNDRSARVSVEKYQILWKRIEKEANDDNFGLHFSEATKGSFGGNILCAVMMNCPNIEEAANRFIKYYGLLSDLIVPELEMKEEFAYFTWKSNIPEKDTSRHQTESFLIMLQSILQCLGCKNIIEVRFKHFQPADISEHKNVFSGKLCFDWERNEIVIRREDLLLPIALSSAELLSAHERVAEKVLDRLKSKNTWSDKVTELLSKNLLNNNLQSIDTVASELALSTRNLQIRLKEEGYTYQTLLDKVREEIALNYMSERNVTFYDIVFFLGFSEQSSFNRAFKRWTGLNPNDYRKRLRFSSPGTFSY